MKLMCSCWKIGDSRNGVVVVGLKRHIQIRPECQSRIQPSIITLLMIKNIELTRIPQVVNMIPIPTTISIIIVVTISLSKWNSATADH